MSSNSILIAGHSHISALGVPLRSPDYALRQLEDGEVPLVGLAGGWPREDTDYWTEIAARSAGRTVAIFWRGNQHFHHFLIMPSDSFDFLLHSEPDLTIDTALPIVPESTLIAFMREDMSDLDPIIAAIQQTGGRVVLCGTPPPKGDAEFVRERTVNEQYFRDAASSMGLDINDVTLSPPLLLYKIWKVMQNTLEEVAARHGAGFLPVPKQLQTAEGFLHPDYYARDATHANDAYGAHMRAALKAFVLSQQGRQSLTVDPVARRERAPTPYSDLPARQRWSQGVSRAFRANEVGSFARPLILPSDRIVSAGSCFAANLVPYLRSNGFNYLRTEFNNPHFGVIAREAMNYASYSAGYGNIYTPRQLRQLLARALGEFKPEEDRWLVDGEVIDPYRPGLRYRARSEREFDLVTASHLRAVREAFTNCDVFIFTFGLTEAWLSAVDGAVFPACPGTIAGRFDPEKHVFRNFGFEELLDDLRAFIAALRAINPKVRFIFTVSPVPLVATATGQHVLEATIYSKSLLRVVADAICQETENAWYFPAYEIVTGPQAPEDFFEPDRRDVSRKGVETVVGAFLEACNLQVVATIRRGKKEPSNAEMLSSAVAEAECEEVAQAEQPLPGAGSPPGS